MVATYDNIFNREFKDMMNSRKAHITGFALSTIPLPDFKSVTPSNSTFYTGAKTRKVALVKGVTEPFFERLNNTEVELVGRAKLYKRQVLSDGSFRKDNNNKYVADEVTVPHTSVAVLSPISIGLKRFKEDSRGSQIEHRPSEGYKYVDYVETKEGRKYIYIVPKQLVFRLTLVALMLTHHRHRNFYHGTKIALQNGHYIYLYTAPYTYRENTGAYILGLKASTNFDTEVKQLLDFWQKTKVMFPIQDTQLKEQINGLTNLGFQEMEGTLTIEDFKRLDKSLADEVRDDLETY